MEKKKAASLLLLLRISFVFAFSSEAKHLTLPSQALDSINLTYIQQIVGSCSYTVTITTSCYSPINTRDQISISFGDSYGNQVYAPRLDDPSAKAFEQCSTDTYQLYGPCAYQICYVYLYRSGPDGWEPESVTISGYNTKDATFYFYTFIPDDVWYGFDLCRHSASSSHRYGWFQFLILGFSLISLVTGTQFIWLEDAPFAEN